MNKQEKQQYLRKLSRKGTWKAWPLNEYYGVKFFANSAGVTRKVVKDKRDVLYGYATGDKHKRPEMSVTDPQTGKRLRPYVYEVIQRTFNGVPPETMTDPVVNHLDEDPTNNAIENLSWCERDDNVIYSSKANRIEREGTNVYGEPITQMRGIFDLLASFDRLYPTNKDVTSV